MELHLGYKVDLVNSLFLHFESKARLHEFWSYFKLQSLSHFSEKREV